MLGYRGDNRRLQFRIHAGGLRRGPARHREKVRERRSGGKAAPTRQACEQYESSPDGNGGWVDGRAYPGPRPERRHQPRQAATLGRDQEAD